MFRPLGELAKIIHRNAVDKGWWEDERKFPEIAALIHCEISEAMEEYRVGFSPTTIYYPLDEKDVKSNKPEGMPIELADTIIRILDYCGKEDIDIDEAIRIKMAYNATRPHRHGGKLA